MVNALRLTLSGMQGMVVQEALGQLSWDLPAQKDYTPNTDLPFTFTITNPTADERTYKIQLQLVVGGKVAWFSDFLPQGWASVWFPVAPGGSGTISGTIKPDRSNSTFQAVLIDQATGQSVAQVACNLVGPTTIADTLTTIMPLMMLVMMMGLVSSMTGMFRGKAAR